MSDPGGSAPVSELADEQDLGSCAVRRVGSSPIRRSKKLEGECKMRSPVLSERVGSSQRAAAAHGAAKRSRQSPTGALTIRRTSPKTLKILRVSGFF